MAAHFFLFQGEVRTLVPSTVTPTVVVLCSILSLCKNIQQPVYNHIKSYS